MEEFFFEIFLRFFEKENSLPIWLPSRPRDPVEILQTHPEAAQTEAAFSRLTRPIPAEAGNMAHLHQTRSKQPEEFIRIEDWQQFGRNYRAQFDFCRILQQDFVAAETLFFDSKLAAPEGRAMVRCFGSFLDGITGAMRNIAIATCRLFRQPLNPFLQDKAEERNITTHQRVYTTYRLLTEFLPGSPMARATDQLWDDLHKALEIRNRVAHPKTARDLELAPEEGMLVADVGDEFFAHLNQFAQWLLQKEQKLLAPHLVEVRRLYRKIGRNETCPCGSGRKHKHCCGLAPLTL